MRRVALATLLVAAAPAPSVPPTLANGPVITHRDYPDASLAANETGIVSTSILVDANGKPRSCQVTETSLYPRLDRATCALLLKRARFTPAQDADGRPVAGEYFRSTSFGIDRKQPSSTIMTSLTVERAPPNYRQPVRADAEFDGAGAMVACRVTASSGSAAADATACAWAKGQVRISPPVSGSDIAPCAHRTLVVTFAGPAR